MPAQTRLLQNISDRHPHSCLNSKQAFPAPPQEAMPRVVLPVKVAETGAVINVELQNPYQDDR